MAIIKMGAIVTAIKGKVGGHIFQGSVSGSTLRTKFFGGNWNPNPIVIEFKKQMAVLFPKRMANNQISNNVSVANDNPSLLGQVFYDGSRNAFIGLPSPQAILASLSSTWRNLDDTSRMSWTAGAVNYPFKNKLGDTYIGSGFQVYMQLNTNLLQIFKPALSVCPIPTGAVLPNIITDWTDQNKAQLALLEFPDGIASNLTVQIYASPTRSAGRTSSLNSQLIATIASGSAVSIPLRQAYESCKGFIASGSSIVFSIFIINNDTGVQMPVTTAKLKVVFGGRGQLAIISDATVVRAWVPTDLSTTINLGSLPSGDSIVLPFLLYGLQLGDPWTLTKGGADPTQFDFTFDGYSPTAGVISGGCDSFGDMIGFFLKITFSPTSVGVKTFTITLDCPAIPFTKTVTFQGTST